MKAAERDPRTNRQVPRVCILAFAFIALALLAPAASADVVFGATQGPGAGQTNDPSAIALDREAGLLYVADRENHRIDVFKVDGSFLRAFGWGVADSTTAALQTCTAACFKGLGGGNGGSFGASGGGGAGEFSELTSIAVDNDPASPGHHDVYVTDGARVQKFSTDDNGTPVNPADDKAVFERAWGAGVITAGATGTGDLTAGSTTIANVNTTAKRFLLGQAIAAPSKIPAGTKIVGLGEGTIVLSQPASASGTGVTLTVAAGAGHVAVNEVHELTIESESGGGKYSFQFETPNPSPTIASKEFTYVPAAPAATIKAQLEELSNIDPGDIAVSGPAGGPYLVEFIGRYADTDVLTDSSLTGTSTVGKFKDRTFQNGASAAAICTAANAADCSAGVRGKGPGQFSQSLEVATGPGGAVHVGDDRAKIGNNESGSEPRLQAFDPAGVPSGELLGIESSSGLAFETGGDFYAVGNSAVRKYDSAGILLSTINPSSNVHAIALDPAGNLFVADSTPAIPGKGGGQTTIYEYDPAGALIHVLYGSGTLKGPPRSLAPYTDATGDLFVLQEAAFGNPRGLAHIAIEPPGPVVLPFAAQVGDPAGTIDISDTRATNIGNLSATLNTRLNPEDKASTVHFQYVDDAAYKAEGGFAGAKKTITTPESASLGADFKAHEEHFDIPCAGPGKPGCLAANTVYHFRAAATNADGTDIGPEATFETLPPLTLGGVWATDVGTDSARLHAALNPNGIAATVHFEYVDGATFQESGFATAQKTPSIDFGAGALELSKSALISSLTPGTYRYRYVAEDFFGKFVGPEGALSTIPASGLPKEDCPNQAFRTGASAGLPDCRAYELVSPLDKNNGDAFALADFALTSRGSPQSRIDQATPGGEALTYSSYRAFGDPRSAPWNSQYIARRDPVSGWSSLAVNPPREGPSFTSSPYQTFFRGFSEDLCSAWFVQDTDLALAPGAPPGVPNLYRRQNCGGEESYQLLTTVAPPGWGPGAGKYPAAGEYFPSIQGFSADGKATAFKAPARLTEDASEAEIYQTYLFREGALHLISVLPNGKAAKTHSSVGKAQRSAGRRFYDSVAGAVSADGSRVFWSAEIEEPPIPVGGSKGGGADVGNGPSRLYLRLNDTQAQSKVSKGKCTEPAKACTIQVTEGAAVFHTADPQATRALYTTNDTTNKGGDLYELDVAKAAAYEAGAATLIAHRASLLGASEDLSRVYFGSDEDLDGAGPAAANKLNLYLRGAGGGLTFIATLGVQGGGSFSSEPVDHNARVSADGLHAAFMSEAPLTGYDNTDAASGKADSEVFLYDADEGKLRCVSCNPSGARPLGRTLYPGVGFWAAAQIPGWETVFQASRPLSSDGKRLFFDSFEALVPRDTNGKQDVYEWERAESKAQCLGEIGGEVFVAASGGCLGLISSGKGSDDAEFIDASASGSDVFLATAASLLPQDYGLADIYDAREGGGFPPPPGQAGVCEGEACQSAPPPPNDPTPASASFKGAGNLHQGRRRSCAKGKVHRRGRCVAKKQKRNRHRANHKRRAGR